MPASPKSRPTESCGARSTCEAPPVYVATGATLVEDADEIGAQAAAVVVPETGTAEVVCVDMPHEAVVDVEKGGFEVADQSYQGSVEVCTGCTVVVVVVDQSIQGSVEVCAGCTVVEADDAGHSPQL